MEQVTKRARTDDGPPEGRPAVYHRRRAIDTARQLHAPILATLRAAEEARRQASRVLHTRFEIIARGQNAGGSGKCERRGDRILAAMRDTFHNGLGIEWGEHQIRVFNGFVFSSLALIYDTEWADNKARVLKEWKEERECPYTVVSMARRNGKTFSTSGVVVCMLLCIPNVKVAIFSTCKRTSMLMMQAIMEMLDKAFERGTHADRQKFTQVSKNMESLVLEGPDKTRRQLGCYPGSVRVSMCLCFGCWWRLLLQVSAFISLHLYGPSFSQSRMGIRQRPAQYTLQ